MIDITIKTLDSQNHSFSVADDTTVKQFKEKIFEQLPFPIDSQRLIYCGRVLQDDKNLSEYDVNGKVIHLVQRPPPQASAPPSASSRAPGSGPRPGPNSRRFLGGQTFRSRLDGGNTMYLGAMAIPADVLDASGITSLQPSQNLTQSRLTIARRIIRSAAQILSQLENSGADPPAESVTPPNESSVPAEATGEPSTSTANQEQEESPRSSGETNGIASSTAAVIASVCSAARSAGMTGHMTSHMTISRRSRGEDAVTLSVDLDSQGNITHVGGENVPLSTSSEMSSPPQEAAVGPEGPQEAASSAGTETNPGTPFSRRPSLRGVSRPMALAQVLDELNAVNLRLQPFYDRYLTLMREDPTFEDEAAISAATTLFNRVSEVMHSLSHAYHALSDIMCDFTQSAPRVLRCRPVLVQHQAVLQAGIPISAQISMMTNRPPATTQSTPQPSTETTSTPAATNEEETQAPTANADQATMPVTSEPSGGTPLRQPRVRILRSGNSNSRNGPNITNLTPGNVEFIMEVGPGSITIDSVEATLMSGNGTSVPLGSLSSIDATVLNEVGGFPGFPWGSPAPPEFIQNLMQAVAGHMINRSNDVTSNTPAAPTTTSNGTSDATTTSNGATPTNVPGQNSQARGNTATHPTTSTQTRSTSRPHVHLAQSMPSFGASSFDPFLPCNSRHIVRPSRRRGTRTRTDAAQEEREMEANGPAQPDPSAQASPDEQDPLMNLIEDIIDGYAGEAVTVQPSQSETNERPTAATNTPISPLFNIIQSLSGQDSLLTSDGGVPTLSMPMIQQVMQSLSQGLGGAILGQSSGTTLADILETIPDASYNEGQVLLTDLIMTLARNLSFQDMVALGVGRGETLNHVQPQLREFMNRRVLQNEEPTLVNIGVGAERMTREIRPYLDTLQEARLRPDIDVIQTVNNFNEIRLAEMIEIIVRERHLPNSFGRWLTGWFLTYVRELCAIVRHCCLDGMVGVERILQSYVRRLTQGIPQAIQDWTITSSLTHLRTFTTGTDVPVEEIQRFIILREAEAPIVVQVQDELQSSSAHEIPVSGQVIDEPMETDAPPNSQSGEAEPLLVTDTLPGLLPLLVDGDEIPPLVPIPQSWHSALPSDWVPIISRDSQRQRRQNPQTPFSDSYLSGMPSKRRKVVASAKPQGNLSQVISEGVRHASEVTGMAPNVGNIETVAEAASTDPNLQAAYRDQVRAVVRDSLNNNPDFAAERFPNTAKYFTKK